MCEGKKWRLKNPLYGLNDASRKFWLKVKEMFAETGILRLKENEAYYYCYTSKGTLEGMVSSHVDDFTLVDNKEFLNIITEK